MAVEPIIVTDGLTRHFGRLVAVDHLNLTVYRGEVFGFLGPNGAGKTTTIRLLNGILRPTEGRAYVLGMDVSTQGDAVRRHTGVLTENPSLYEHLTARENLRFFGEVYGYPAERLAKRIEVVLDEMGLADRADEPVGTFSKGMKQRLAIGKALLHEPPILFLDEPTAGLDPAASRAVTAMIAQLSHQEGRTIFLCTHNLVEAQRLCDRVGVINRGILQAVGAPAELARQLWSGLRVEMDLRGEPSEAIRLAITTQEGVRQMSFVDGKVRLDLENEECIPDVVEAVVRAGGRIYSVMPMEHSLEEIYFEIQGSSGAPAQEVQ